MLPSQEDEYLGRLEQFLKCEELAGAAHTTRIAQDERTSWFHQDLALLLQDAVKSVKVRVFVAGVAVLVLF
jgi:hypothetical protein